MSIWNKITNPRETYTDGYGAEREVYEPQWVTAARNLYNKGKNIYQNIDRKVNYGKYLTLTDPETGEIYKPTINSGAGLMADVFDPTGAIGKIDDVIKIIDKTKSFKDKVSILNYYGVNRDKIRRKGFALKNYTKDLPGKPLIGVGKEAYVMIDPNDKSRVLKFVKHDFLKDNLFLYDLPILSRKDLRDYFKFYSSKRNNIPHQQPLSLEGYWYRDGQINPVVSQKRMLQGKSKINFDDVTKILNEENDLIIHDVKPDNIMIDENGMPWGIDTFTIKKQGGTLKSQPKLLTPHKDYLGIPYKQDDDYNYFEAHPTNMPTNPEEHWTSRNPVTGQLLKSENHPTFNHLLNGEQEAGTQIYRGLNGELYSYPKEQQVPLYLKKYNYGR